MTHEIHTDAVLEDSSDQVFQFRDVTVLPPCDQVWFRLIKAHAHKIHMTPSFNYIDPCLKLTLHSWCVHVGEQFCYQEGDVGCPLSQPNPLRG